MISINVVTNTVEQSEVDMFTFTKRPKKNNVIEINNRLSNEMTLIDKDVLLMLKPLNMMESLFLCAKYKIRDDMVLANNSYYRLVSLFGLLIIITLHLYALWFDVRFGNLGRLGSIVQMCYIVNAIFIAVGFLLNHYLTLKHRYNNVLLLLKLHNAHRIINVDARKCMKTNWVILVLLNCFFFLWLFYFWSTFDIHCWDIITTYSTILFDINVLYASRLLSILKLYLEMWIKHASKPGYIGDDNHDGNTGLKFSMHLRTFWMFTNYWRKLSQF